MISRAAFVLLALPLAAAGKGHGRFDIQTFKTEPSIRVPKVTILNITQNRSLLQPGYVFLDSDLIQPPEPGGGTGPMIYDQEGHLVWSGADSIASDSWRTQHTHVCTFLGQVGTHICTTEARDVRPPGDGNGHDPVVDQYGIHRIFDHEYNAVASDSEPITTGFQTPQRPDQHEFALVDNGTSFLRAIYHTTTADFSPFGGDAAAPIQEGCVQDVEVATRKVLFQWCGLDNVKLNDSVHWGQSWVLHPKKEDPPWDWMHVNSVDKNEEGDYLVSVRYFNQLIKIAGPNAKAVHGIEPGTMIWRLGGFAGDIQLLPGVEFSLQHDARFYSTTKSETVVTVFDNSGALSHPICSGKMIKINHDTMQAELVGVWIHPDGVECDSMGSMRMQPNGNAVIGWGNQALFSEFDASGNLLYHATFIGRRDPSPRNMYNYRSLKETWVGRPSWDPKLVVYAKSCRRGSSPLVAYASWNGATEVAFWRFSVSMFGKRGTWFGAGVFAKDDFETRAILVPRLPSVFASHFRYVSVEALDRSWKVLGHTVRRTFVPRDADLAQCDDFGCYGDAGRGYNATGDFAASCPVADHRTTAAGLASFLVLVLVAAGVVWVGRHCYLNCGSRRKGERQMCSSFDKRERQMYSGSEEPLLFDKIE